MCRFINLNIWLSAETVSIVCLKMASVHSNTFGASTCFERVYNIERVYLLTLSFASVLSCALSFYLRFRMEEGGFIVMFKLSNHY